MGSALSTIRRRHRQLATRAKTCASRAEGVHPCDGWLHGIAAAAQLAAGDIAGAREELQGARSELRRGDRSVMHYLRAGRALLEDDLALANAEARTAAELSAETGMPWLECSL